MFTVYDSITKWKFTQTKILKKCLLFPLILQLYFIKEIENSVPHWKELDNLPKESAIADYFTHPLCVIQAHSFLLLLAICTCHKRVTNIYLSVIIVVGAPKLRQKEDDVDFQVFSSQIWKLAIIGKRTITDWPITDCVQPIPWDSNVNFKFVILLFQYGQNDLKKNDKEIFDMLDEIILVNKGPFTLRGRSH